MKIKRGFTLIELLIVIAVLGVLTAAVLVALDPAEQLARTRDSSRVTSISDLGKATAAYYVNQSAYPTADTTWITTLINAGELKTGPTNQSYSSGDAGCTVGFNQNNFCYNMSSSGNGDAVVYAKLESKSQKSKGTTFCNDSGTPVANRVRYFVWAASQNRAGVTCSEPGLPFALSFIP
ncbi:type II secretion system protein [Candidatus Microgenomates bacterium]|nr:type II secretion system protein [Candidatus Microgenomates bacterium]